MVLGRRRHYSYKGRFHTEVKKGTGNTDDTRQRQATRDQLEIIHILADSQVLKVVLAVDMDGSESEVNVPVPWGVIQWGKGGHGPQRIVLWKERSIE